MKVIKNGSTIIVVLDSGVVIHKNNCTEDMISSIKQGTTEEEVLPILRDDLKEVYEQKAKAKAIVDNINKSSLLVRDGNSFYWKGVSKLSMPQSLVDVVIKAEQDNNQDALEAYRNFWVLLSLNPDPICRENLYWFLDRWGMRISKAGLFIGYRNVDIYQEGTQSIYTQALCDYVVSNYERIRKNKKSPKNYDLVISQNIYSMVPIDKEVEELNYDIRMNLLSVYNELKAVNFIADNIGNDTIYTDHHSHTFRIKVGELVTMPREECDCTQVSCSRGLHLGGIGWLRQGYYGGQGLVCLCNPACVVAVPKIDDYGKLRTCEYLPIALVEYDNHGDIIPYNVEDGFESKWIKEVIYNGIQSEEDTPKYELHIPEIPELDKTEVSDNLLAIARTYMK